MNQRTPTARTVVDLTHVFSAALPVFPGDREPSRKSVRNFAEHGFQVSAWELWDHTGTHLDAPAHLVPGGATVSQIPIDSLIAPAVVIDLRLDALASPDASLQPHHIQQWEAQHGRIQPGSAVLLRTGWDAFIGDAARYLRLDLRGVPHFPGFSPEAAGILVEDRQVVGIGTDTASIDPGVAADLPVHQIVLGAGRWALENLANLGSLPAAGAELIAAPVPFSGSSGAPARVFAFVG